MLFHTYSTYRIPGTAGRPLWFSVQQQRFEAKVEDQQGSKIEDIIVCLYHLVLGSDDVTKSESPPNNHDNDTNNSTNSSSNSTNNYTAKLNKDDSNNKANKDNTKVNDGNHKACV